MKTFTLSTSILALLLCLSSLALGQSELNCDQLRTKTGSLEQMDMAPMSPSLRQIYKEALLKLYLPLLSCIENELKHSEVRRPSAKGADEARTLEAKIEALSKELTTTRNKITILTTALGVPNPVTEGSVAAPSRDEERDAKNQPVATGVKFECIAGAPYNNAPLLLSDIVTKAADGVVQGDFGGDLSGLPQMMLYATLDGASVASSKLLRDLKPYQYLSETARTDKQLGASAKSDGSVSAIEKPGFARLLGFALEHGGITRKNDGTNLPSALRFIPFTH